MAWTTQKLPELPEGSVLTRFLPQVALEPPEYDLRCRSALASTLVAGLELARQGEITLGQDQVLGMVQVHAVQGAPVAAQGERHCWKRGKRRQLDGSVAVGAGVIGCLQGSKLRPFC